MKKLTVVIALLFLGIGCKKKDDDQPTINVFVLQAMTNGHWIVTTFDKGGVDRAGDFQTYQFKFNTNLTVDAIKNGSVEKTGTWTANTDDKTITSTFPGVSEPLELLNGTWIITKTTWTSVDAYQNTGGELRVLHLDKL